MKKDSNDLPSATIPSIIAGYTITDKVGIGAFSKVYKGLSPSSKDGVRTTVAIKCIDLRSTNTSKLNSDCIVAEIKILKSMKHRYIVRLIDFQWDRNNVYLIMEYCGGGDLGSFIAEHGRISEPVVRYFFRQLAAAIQYMHALNVAHMDLKPQNVLLTNRHRPLIKVSDFGLSQYLKQSEYSRSFRGSPLYMAPEIINRGQYDSRVDLWSSGIILYECLYGKPPFFAESYEALLRQIISNDSIRYPTDVRVSFDCMDLLQKLLVRIPQQRISFEKFFSHAFINLYQVATKDDLIKADSLVNKSRQAEVDNNIVDAVKLLTKAIQIYINCLDLFCGTDEKCKFREKIRSNLEHAEQLKESLRPIVNEPNREELPSTNMNEVWSDFPQVKAARLIANTARKLELEDKWDEALEKYELAIEGAMKVLACEKKSPRSMELSKEVSRWLTHAEHIKTYMEVMEFNSSRNSIDEEAERQFSELESKKQCSVM